MLKKKKWKQHDTVLLSSFNRFVQAADSFRNEASDSLRIVHWIIDSLNNADSFRNKTPHNGSDVALFVGEIEKMSCLLNCWSANRSCSCDIAWLSYKNLSQKTPYVEFSDHFNRVLQIRISERPVLVFQNVSFHNNNYVIAVDEMRHTQKIHWLTEKISFMFACNVASHALIIKRCVCAAVSFAVDGKLACWLKVMHRLSSPATGP